MHELLKCWFPMAHFVDFSRGDFMRQWCILSNKNCVTLLGVNAPVNLEELTKVRHLL